MIPIEKPVDASILLPGSKYIANRLLPMCALAKSPSFLTNLVVNEDIQTAIKGLSELGYQFIKQNDAIQVIPRASKVLSNPTSVYTAHSGTFSRFVTAIAALEAGKVDISCSDKMATRPMAELFDSLRQLGANISTNNNCLPATIQGLLSANTCELDASRSSQYLSALLIIAPMLEQGLTISLKGLLVSPAYVAMTIALMKQMGVEVEINKVASTNVYKVKAEQSYLGGSFSIPADPVSASYFLAVAAITHGEITIENFDLDSLQGEAQFYKVLEAMGAKIIRQQDKLKLTGPEKLKSIEIDMGDMPDAVPTLAAVACFAEGTTKITNIAQLAFKESNRIEDTATELRKTGIHVETGKDYLAITGGKPSGAIMETYDDHRLAMSFALLGALTQGIKIKDPQVVAKSFPSYWELMGQVGLKSKS